MNDEKHVGKKQGREWERKTGEKIVAKGFFLRGVGEIWTK